MFRFIHSSDLHIGKRFGNMPEDLRGRLREARHAVITTLAEAARLHGATTILLAGDTFDTETPTPAMLRQALAEMGQNMGLEWVLLPGNHDSLLADQLWTSANTAAPSNVRLAIKAEVTPLAPGVFLLPAPCTARRPGRDLTEWMSSAATPDGAIRIGLAHGPIHQFSEDFADAGVIAPDRAARAGLDYLALGDWHGPIAVNTRTRYSGTPEPDRFKHDVPGEAVVVSIAGRDALPEITSVPTARFAWRSIALDLLSSEDSAAAFAAILPASSERRQTLLQILCSGRVRLGGRTALASAIDAVSPEFAHMEMDESNLVTDCEVDDLDMIDRAGALRDAAELLLTESSDANRSSTERDVARDALVRLFTYCEAIDP